MAFWKKIVYLYKMSSLGYEKFKVPLKKGNDILIIPSKDDGRYDIATPHASKFVWIPTPVSPHSFSPFEFSSPSSQGFILPAPISLPKKNASPKKASPKKSPKRKSQSPKRTTPRKSQSPKRTTPKRESPRKSPKKTTPVKRNSSPPAVRSPSPVKKKATKPKKRVSSPSPKTKQPVVRRSKRLMNKQK